MTNSYIRFFNDRAYIWDKGQLLSNCYSSFKLAVHGFSISYLVLGYVPFLFPSQGQLAYDVKLQLLYPEIINLILDQ